MTSFPTNHWLVAHAGVYVTVCFSYWQTNSQISTFKVRLAIITIMLAAINFMQGVKSRMNLLLMPWAVLKKVSIVLNRKWMHFIRYTRSSYTEYMLTDFRGTCICVQLIRPWVWLNHAMESLSIDKSWNRLRSPCTEVAREGDWYLRHCDNSRIH